MLSDAKAEADIKYDFQELRLPQIRLVFGPQQESLLDGISLVLVSLLLRPLPYSHHSGSVSAPYPRVH